VILGRGPDHCGPADIDVLDGVLDRGAFSRNRLLERIQVHHQQIDRLDAVFCHDRLVGAAAPEQATVDDGVQGLDPAVHDLWKTGLLRDFDHVQAGFAQLATGTARRQHLDAEFREAGYKWNQSTLVRDTDERTSYVEH